MAFVLRHVAGILSNSVERVAEHVDSGGGEGDGSSTGQGQEATSAQARAQELRARLVSLVDGGVTTEEIHRDASAAIILAKELLEKIAIAVSGDAKMAIGEGKAYALSLIRRAVRS